MFVIDKLNYLQIGVQGEHLSTKVEFDMTAWAEEFPEADFHVLFKRYNEEHAAPMPCVYKAATKVLTWTVTESATAVVGVGYTEVRAVDPSTGMIKKTRIIPTAVENSVSGISGEPPAAWQDWYNNVLQAKTDTDKNRSDSEAWAVGQRDGEDVPQSDPTWNRNSKFYAGLAEQALPGKGYMFVYVDEDTGHLIYNATEEIDIDLEINDGRLIAIWPGA